MYSGALAHQRLVTFCVRLIWSQAAVVGARLLDINPKLHLTVMNHFVESGEAEALVGVDRFDYLVDCSECSQLLLPCRGKTPCLSSGAVLTDNMATLECEQLLLGSH